MEPDVAHMYPTFPPSLDEGPEEEDDDFGDFGGFSDITSTGTFAEFDSPVGLCQARETEALSPGSFSNGTTRLAELGLRNPIIGSGGNFRGSLHSFCPSGKNVLMEDLKGPAVQFCPSTGWKPAGPGAAAGWPDGESASCAGGVMVAEVFTNGFAHSAVGDPDVTDLPYLSNGSLTSRGRCFAAPADCLKVCAAQLTERDINWAAEKSRENNGDSPAVVTKGLTNGSQDEAVPQGTVASHGRQCFSQRAFTVGPHREVPIVRKVGAEVKDHGEQEGSGLLVSGDMEEGQWGRRRYWLQNGPSERKYSHKDSTSSNEDFASFCQALSPDTLEDCDDFGFGHAGLSGVMKDKNSGDHKEGSSLKEEGFADFSQAEPSIEMTSIDFVLPRESPEERETADFDLPKHCVGEGEGAAQPGLPGSDSFADFSSAPVDAEPGLEWDAFGEKGVNQAGGESWVAFALEEEHAACSRDSAERWQDASTAPPCGSPVICRWRSHSLSLTSRLEGLFQESFPPVPGLENQEEVLSLGMLLQEPTEVQGTAIHWAPRDMWQHLQDIHGALGLRYQWSGSRGNKALLHSLGVDSRSVLFTGQKKQLVVESPSAPGLGVLEPTKEFVMPISTAEISCIAQTSPVSPEISSSPSHSTQEALPPVQFDWNSSGLTNPLGGASIRRAACAGQARHGSFS